jgi:uncharacterized membrane protein (UPF0127 family)
MAISISKNFGVVPIITGIIIVILAAFFIFVMPNLTQPTTYLRLGDGVFKAKIVTTEADRNKGLSGVSQLGSDQALLMVFPDQEKWGIWMKNMNIPIDVVWLNSDKKVVYAVKYMSPSDPTTVYSPKIPAKYVVELPAGTVDSKAITGNSVATFQLNSGNQ